jgi:cobalt/nickel transport system permease protein
MHLYEGILAATPHGQEVLLAGAAAAAVGTAIGLHKLDYEKLPATAMLSSVFFVASLVQVPLPPTSTHLMLSGLMGLVLGWSAFPAILVALLLQSVFLPVPLGLSTLGLNTLVMALPAVCCYYLFRVPLCSHRQRLVLASGFAAGATAILLSALLSAGALMLAGKQFAEFAKVFFCVHVPSAMIEGLVTSSVVVLLRKVRPEVLQSPLLAPAIEEAFDG